MTNQTEVTCCTRQSQILIGVNSGDFMTLWLQLSAHSACNPSPKPTILCTLSFVWQLCVPWIWWSRIILSVDHISKEGFPRSTPDPGGSHIWDTFFQILINFHPWILCTLWSRMGRASSPRSTEVKVFLEDADVE